MAEPAREPCQHPGRVVVTRRVESQVHWTNEEIWLICPACAAADRVVPKTTEQR